MKLTDEVVQGLADRGWDAPAFTAALERMEDYDRKSFFRLLTHPGDPWRPLQGRQSMAYWSEADIIGYGGAAGGGKSDLMVGKVLTQHRKAMILRREATQLTGVIDRLTEILGNRDGYNGQDKIWRRPGLQIEFGSTPNAGDETKYQGRPHDFLGFDEATNFLEHQVRFLLGWLRTTTPGQRCQALLTFNPPTTAEGRWVIPFFAPWLDDRHPNPAKPGELRWFATLDGRDVEVTSAEPFDHDGLMVQPLSRSFVPSRITDNPHLMDTGYMATLQALPEPLRSQMLHGDFMAGVEDDPWQVIPTAWVDAAMSRWQPRNSDRTQMDSLGVDVARGGRDETIIARRHGLWFDEMLALQGAATSDGPAVMAEVIRVRRDKAPVHVDVIGVGSSPYDLMKTNGVQAVACNGAEASGAQNREGTMAFTNKRAEWWWRMREALDPDNDQRVTLPPDQKLRADLCAPMWRLEAGGIRIEKKDEIIKRIGRSPDRGDAACMALIATRKTADVRYVPRGKSRSAWAA